MLGHARISIDFHGAPLISMDIHGHPLVSKDIHGYAWFCSANRRADAPGRQSWAGRVNEQKIPRHDCRNGRRTKDGCHRPDKLRGVANAFRSVPWNNIGRPSSIGMSPMLTHLRTALACKPKRSAISSTEYEKSRLMSRVLCVRRPDLVVVVGTQISSQAIEPPN